MSGSGQLRADERKIRQVVLNVLSNAIKFTPEGGRIEVAAVPRDEFVEVSVSDTGVGIAPEDQEAVFEEFRQVGTAAKKVEGTGLGLALSRKFIELHGGRIWVAEPGGDRLDVHVHDPGAAGGSGDRVMDRRAFLAGAAALLAAPLAAEAQPSALPTGPR